MPHEDIFELSFCVSFEAKVYSEFINRALFGHLCWGLRWQYGVNKLREFLDLLKNDKLRIAIADPRPCIMDNNDNISESFLPIVDDSISKFKPHRLKKKFLRSPTMQFALDLNASNQFGFFARQSHVNLQGNVSRVYLREYFVPNTFYCFEIQLTSESDNVGPWIKQITQALILGLSGGYGGKTSLGVGRVSVKDFKVYEFTNMYLKHHTRYLALGHFLPDKRIFQMSSRFAYDFQTWMGWSQMGWSYPKMLLFKPGSWLEFNLDQQMPISAIWAKPYFYRNCCIVTACPFYEVVYV